MLLLSRLSENLAIIIKLCVIGKTKERKYVYRPSLILVAKSMKALTSSVQLLVEQFLRDCCDFLGCFV